jgi:hypothetical protein
MMMACDDPQSNTQPDTDYEKTTPEQLLIRIKEWWREDFPDCNEAIGSSVIKRLCNERCHPPWQR